MTPHDALFKATFSEPAAAAGLCRTLLPPAVVDQLELDQLTVVPGSFVEPELQSRHSDLLLQVPMREGRAAFLYLLTEHQRRPERRMAWRMTEYLVALYRRWLRDHPDDPWLPPVVPIVIYNGTAAWGVPRRLTALMGIEAEARAALGAHLLDVEFVLDDLTQCTDAELVSRAMPAAARAALLALRNADGDLYGALHNALELLQTVLKAPSGADALVRLIRYGLHVSADFTEERAMALMHDVDPFEKVLPLPGSEGDRLRKEGLEQGLEQGLAQGLVRARDLLSKQLRLKFGPLPEAAAARVAQATFDELEVWGERLFTAATLTDCLAD